MENTNEQEKGYYTLVLSKLTEKNEDLKSTVDLIQEAMCYSSKDTIEMLALLPCIVAERLVLQDAQLLQRKLFELGCVSYICKDTDILSHKEKEPDRAPTEIFKEKSSPISWNKREGSVLLKCPVCCELTEDYSLERFVYHGCLHCGAHALLAPDYNYKSQKRIKEEHERKICLKLEGKPTHTTFPKLPKIYASEAPKSNTPIDSEEREDAL